MASVFHLEATDDEDEDEEWKTSLDPVRLKFWRNVEKSTYSGSLKRVLLAVKVREKREEIRVKQRMLICDYESVVKRHRRYMQYATHPTAESLEEDIKWMADIQCKQAAALESIEAFLRQLHRPAAPVSSPNLSTRSSKSLIPPLTAMLLETDRLEREIETRKRLDAIARERQAEEYENTARLESARKAEEKRIAADRRQRELCDQLKKLCSNSELLRRQLCKNSSSANDNRYTARLYRSDQVPFISIRASVRPSQQAAVASDSFTSPASPARARLPESTPVQFEPSDSESHDLPSPYPAVPVEGACCSHRHPDYCSCSAAIVAPGSDTAVLYSKTKQRIEDTSVGALSDSHIPHVNRMDDSTPAGLSVVTSTPHRFTPALDERASTPVVPFAPLLVKSKPSSLPLLQPVCSSRLNGPTSTLQVRRGVIVREEDRQSPALTLHGPATRPPILPLEFPDQLEFTVAPVSPSDGPAALDLLPTRDWPSLT